MIVFFQFYIHRMLIYLYKIVYYIFPASSLIAFYYNKYQILYILSYLYQNNLTQYRTILYVESPAHNQLSIHYPPTSWLLFHLEYFLIIYEYISISVGAVFLDKCFSLSNLLSKKSSIYIPFSFNLA